MIRTLVFWGLCAVLVFLPLPRGSVEEWAVFIFEAAVIGLFLLYLGGEAAAHRKSPAGEDKPAGIPVAVKILLGVFLAFLVLQVVPLPAAAVRLLSPRAYDIAMGLARDGVIAPRSWLTLSLAPRTSLSEAVLIICYGIFGYLFLRAVRTRREVEILVLVMIASGLFQAVYGMAEVFSGHEMIFGRPKLAGLGSVTGTYVNRNHFAGFLEMIFPLSLGYLLVKARYFAMEQGLSLKRRILWFSQESLQWTFLLGLAPVFIGVGLVFSKSRMGIFVLAVTIVLAGAAAATWRESSTAGTIRRGAGIGHDTRQRFGRILRLVVLVVLAGAVYLGVGPVIERFSEVDVSYKIRRVFYENTLRLIGDFPWTGTGTGTYGDAYAAYETVDDRLRLSHAHNDYLEFASENGIIAGAALSASGIALVFWMAAMWRRKKNSFAKGIGLGAVLGVTAILIHGFADFNLQVPANAAYFAAMAMLGVIVLGRSERSMDDHGDRPGRPGPAGRFGRLSAAILAAALLVPAVGDFLGFQRLSEYRKARREARSVESAFPRLEALLDKAVSASGLPVFRVEQARLYAEMARVSNDAGRSEEREALCSKAEASFGRAIASDPINARTHYEAGTVFLISNYPLMTYADRAAVYFRNALEFKPADAFINLSACFLYFSRWATLEEKEKAYAAGLYRKMTEREPGFPARLADSWNRYFGSAGGLGAVLDEFR